MRKEVLCVLVVLGGGWAQAQQAPSGATYPESYQGYPQAYQGDPAANNYAASAAYGGGYAAGYGGNSGYYYPQGYGATTPVDYTYGTGYGYNYPQGYNYGYGNGYGYGYPQGYNYGNGYGYGYGYGYPQGYNYGTGYAASPAGPAAAGPEAGAPVGTGETPTEGAAPEGAPEPASSVHKPRWWMSAEYLGAWVKQGPLNTPLVTTGSPADVSPGALGQPSTAVVFGPNNFDLGAQQGARVEMGFFLDKEQHFSFDFIGLGIFPSHLKSLFASDSTGNPLISRPVFNAATQSEYFYLTSFPAALTGSTLVELTTDLWGWEANGQFNVCCSPHFNMEFLGGFRMLHLDEKLSIQDNLNPLTPGNITFLGGANFVNPPNAISDFDQFTTNNNLYGINVGTRLHWQWDWFSLNLYGKVALGVTEENVKIQGSTTLITPTGNQTTAGGILAQPSNIGGYNRSVFAYAPEGGFTVGIDPCNHLRLIAGYSFLWWNRVVRPGNLIDRSVNPGQVPTDVGFGTVTGSGNPTFMFKDQAFWLQTLNVGLEVYF